jgi:hypothetical protein
MDEHKIAKACTLFMRRRFKSFYPLGAAILLLYGTNAKGQDFKKNISADAAFSRFTGEQSFALSLTKMHRFGKENKLMLGYGMRYTMYLGINRHYVTAPAELTSGRTGPAVFFTENVVENMDSLLVNRSLHHGFNGVIYLGYQFHEQWSVQFNIDAFGIAFGPDVEGEVISDQKSSADQINFAAKPTTYNVLLISDNDIGLLNSELYLQYKNPAGYGLRFGASFLFTEYTTSTPVEYNFNNNRFRKKSLMGMVAVTWWPFE